MKSLNERRRSAFYDWLLHQGTPSRIASMFIHTASNRVIKMLIEDNRIKVPRK